jgi:hypothetical protein
VHAKWYETGVMGVVSPLLHLFLHAVKESWAQTRWRVMYYCIVLLQENGENKHRKARSPQTARTPDIYCIVLNACMHVCGIVVCGYKAKERSGTRNRKQ